MKKRIEKYFPAAMQAIEAVLYKEKEPIAKEYQGYVSAFGSSVLQMGLLPTLAVHADEGSGAQQDRRKLLEVLARTLTGATEALAGSPVRPALHNKETDLFRIAVERPELRDELREHLLDAVVAVKLCLRTFKLTES